LKVFEKGLREKLFSKSFSLIGKIEQGVKYGGKRKYCL
jgi:hypothetical protein